MSANRIRKHVSTDLNFRAELVDILERLQVDLESEGPSLSESETDSESVKPEQDIAFSKNHIIGATGKRQPEVQVNLNLSNPIQEKAVVSS